MNTPILPPLARPAFKPIMCRDQVIIIGQYYGTTEQSEIFLQALIDFGHLIKSQCVRGTTLRLDFSQFAALIEESLGGGTTGRKKLLRVLREVHGLNVVKPVSADSTVVADQELCATQAA